MLTLTTRAMRAFKLASVNMDPVFAAQGGRFGECIMAVSGSVFTHAKFSLEVS